MSKSVFSPFDHSLLKELLQGPVISNDVWWGMLSHEPKVVALLLDRLDASLIGQVTNEARLLSLVACLKTSQKNHPKAKELLRACHSRLKELAGDKAPWLKVSLALQVLCRLSLYACVILSLVLIFYSPLAYRWSAHVWLPPYHLHFQAGLFLMCLLGTFTMSYLSSWLKSELLPFHSKDRRRVLLLCWAIVVAVLPFVLPLILLWYPQFWLPMAALLGFNHLGLYYSFYLRQQEKQPVLLRVTYDKLSNFLTGIFPGGGLLLVLSLVGHVFKIRTAGNGLMVMVCLLGLCNYYFFIKLLSDKQIPSWVFRLPMIAERNRRANLLNQLGFGMIVLTVIWTILTWFWPSYFYQEGSKIMLWLLVPSLNYFYYKQLAKKAHKTARQILLDQSETSSYLRLGYLNHTIRQQLKDDKNLPLIYQDLELLTGFTFHLAYGSRILLTRPEFLAKLARLESLLTSMGKTYLVADLTWIAQSCDLNWQQLSRETNRSVLKKASEAILHLATAEETADHWLALTVRWLQQREALTWTVYHYCLEHDELIDY